MLTRQRLNNTIWRKMLLELEGTLVLWLNILKWQIIVTSILLWQEYSFPCCRWWLWWCFNCIFAFLGLNLVTHILHDTLTGSVNSCQHFLNCLHQKFWKNSKSKQMWWFEIKHLENDSFQFFYYHDLHQVKSCYV